MLDESRRLAANEWIERLRIQAVSIQGVEYYEKLLKLYQSLIPVSPEERVRMYGATEASTVSPKEAHERLQAAMGLKGKATDGSGHSRLHPRP
jgi:hypothetical protein